MSLPTYDFIHVVLVVIQFHLFLLTLPKVFTCITKCVMQGLSKMCRYGSGTLNLYHPVFLQAIWCRGELKGSP